LTPFPYLDDGEMVTAYPRFIPTIPVRVELPFIWKNRRMRLVVLWCLDTLSLPDVEEKARLLKSMAKIIKKKYQITAYT
jgi:hypothetical protein